MQQRGVLLCALALGCVGLGLYIAGLATPHWYVVGNVTVGFWTACLDTLCLNVDAVLRMAGSKYGYSEALLIECRAYECLGIIASGVGLVLVLLRALLPSVCDRPRVYGASFPLLLTGGVLGVVALVRFCGLSLCSPHGGYSLYLSVGGFSACCISGVVAAFTRPQVKVPEDRSAIL